MYAIKAQVHPVVITVCFRATMEGSKAPTSNTIGSTCTLVLRMHISSNVELGKAFLANACFVSAGTVILGSSQ